MLADKLIIKQFDHSFQPEPGLSPSNHTYFYQNFNLDMIIHVLPGIANIKSAKDLTYLCVNQAFADFVGRSKESLIGTNADYVASLMDNRLPESWADEVNHGDLLIIEKKKEIIMTNEQYFLNQHGKLCVFSLTKSPLLDSRNEIFAILTYTTDITHKKSVCQIRKMYNTLYADPNLAHMKFMQHINMTENNLPLLTKRELDCVILYAHGYSAKAAAKMLKLSYRTFEKHIDNIKIKLDVAHNSQLIDIFLSYYYKQNYDDK